MFVRISCPRCHLSSLWTDEPERFLQGVCDNPNNCRAKVIYEEFAEQSPLPAPLPATSGSQLAMAASSSPPPRRG